MRLPFIAWLAAGILALTAGIGALPSPTARVTRSLATAPPTTELAPLPAPPVANIPPAATAVAAESINQRANGVIEQATPTRTPTPVNIGNFVWDDLDRDGRQDAGEPGLSGVTVQLWNSTKTALLDSAVTNSNGNYTVTAPMPGSYRIRVLLPGLNDAFSPMNQASGDDQLDSDVNPTGTDFGFTNIFTLASNVISTTIYDAGIIVDRPPTPTRTPTPINVGNFVWHDLNANGVQDAGEPGVGGVTVQLWNAAKTALLDLKVTNSNGNYTLVAQMPGEYRVRVLLPAGASFTALNAGANDQLDSDINTTGINFGFTDPYTFGSNLISITTIDAGLRNVVATATPTSTLTPTATTTSSPTRTPTATRTVQPGTTGTPTFDQPVYLPLIVR